MKSRTAEVITWIFIAACLVQAGFAVPQLFQFVKKGVGL